ncbi:MAG: hypothetical protein ABI857_07470 [Acidobacteriota bacterium]
MKKIDMSEKAILRRLRQVDQLRDLCLSLMKAKPLSPEQAAELRAKKGEECTDSKAKVEYLP